MDKKRLCILAYDGLEIDLVEKFDLKNLKQKEYGKTDISEFSLASTPILWGSFLVGENIEEHRRINKFRIGLYKKLKSSVIPKLPEPIENLFHKISRNFDFSDKLTGVGKVEGTTASAFWEFNPSEYDLIPLSNLDTNFKAVNFPLINSNIEEIEETNQDVGKVLNKKISVEKFETKVWKRDKETKKKVINYLGKLDDSQLVLSYFRSPDLLGHLFRGDLDKMQEIYKWFDRMTKEVKERFDGWVLVVSDHGMEKLGRYGDHSDINYAFYSSNIELGLDNPKLTDFYGLIKEKLGE